MCAFAHKDIQMFRPLDKKMRKAHFVQRFSMGEVANWYAYILHQLGDLGERSATSEPPILCYLSRRLKGGECNEVRSEVEQVQKSAYQGWLN